MAGGLTVSVRQIASYPPTPTLAGNELVLLQTGGGLGGPYATATTANLVATALSNGGALGINVVPPAGAEATLFTGYTTYPLLGSSGPWWNAYLNSADQFMYYQGTGPAPHISSDATGNLYFSIAPAGQAGTPVGNTVQILAQLSPAGDLSLPRGTLTVARDPTTAMNVATMGWVGANTVASFNGRRGLVTLSANDVYTALCLDPCDPFITVSQTNAAICAAIQQLLASYPGVSSFNGRLGNVFLSVCDMNMATFAPIAGMPPLMVPTPPPLTADPAPDPQSVVNIAWVENYLGSTSGFATETWVLNQIATTTVTSFNGRLGNVILTLSDITGAGGAPTASPIFSGVPTVPTAAPGSSTSQIASTAFVMAAISNATAGVASFNGRTGAVTLNSTDLTGAGGALLNSPAFTGLPTAPTPAAGNNSTLLATTAFVTAAITAAGGVTSFNTRTGAITLTGGDITGAGGALLASPAFTGTPTGPTAAAGTNNTELATTAFVNAAISSIGIGVTSFEGRTGAVTLQANDISAAGGLINPNVALTGVPTAPTATAGTSSTQIATTAFVNAAILGGTVTAFNGRSGAVTLSGGDISGAGGALLASPTFTGVPAAPTAAPGTNTTQLATTGFVTAALTTQAANSVTSFNGRQGVVTLTTADITGAGGAPIASPTFTGVPAVPTATAGTSTTQAASTAFVMAAIAASTAGVTSFNSRTGAVTLQSNDISAAGGALLASPTFTGTPTAPTPLAGDNSTNIATTAFVQHALSTAAVQSFNGRTGAVTLTLADVTGAGGAPINNPTFTGTVTTAALTATGTANFNAGANTTTLNATAAGGALNVTNSAGRLVFATGGNSGITGETDSVAAAAGVVGEFVTQSFTVSSTSSGVVGSTGQITLQPGDWDIWAFAQIGCSGAGIAYGSMILSTVVNNMTTGAVTPQVIISISSGASLTPTSNTLVSPAARFLNSSATPVYQNFQIFSTDSSATQCSGIIWARRRR